MTTYYVDGLRGDDSWTGRYPLQITGTNGPWKTVTKVAAFAFAPGDTCLFKRGCSYGLLKPGVSGTAIDPIKFGAFGNRKFGFTVFPGVTGNAKNYVTCTGLYFSGDRLWLNNAERRWIFNYCYIGENATAGLWGGGGPFECEFQNCLFARNDGYHIMTTGAATIKARNSIFVGTTLAVGAFSIGAGGNLDLDYCVVIGNTPNVINNANMANVTDGGHNKFLAWPGFLTLPFEDAPRITFGFDDNAAIDSFELMVNGIFATYGVKATIFINPGIWTGAEIVKLLDFISKGHEVALHGWSHVSMVATQLFQVTSTNTAPTVTVDVATTTITLWCAEVANRVVFNWSPDKTIKDLKDAVIGKGWTITNSTEAGKTITDVVKLDCLADSAGPHACPYTTTPDSSPPNYKFWEHEINDGLDAMETVLGIRPKTIALPYGFNNANLRAWMAANTTLLSSRIVGGSPPQLKNVPRWTFIGSGPAWLETSLEEDVRKEADHVAYWMKSTPGYMHYFDHVTTVDWQTRLGWFINQMQLRGVQWVTYRTLVEWIASTHELIGENWFLGYVQTADYRLLETSLCVNAGQSLGLSEDMDGHIVPNGILPDIGLYEYYPDYPDEEDVLDGVLYKYGTLQGTLIAATLICPLIGRVGVFAGQLQGRTQAAQQFQGIMGGS